MQSCSLLQTSLPAELNHAWGCQASTKRRAMHVFQKLVVMGFVRLMWLLLPLSTLPCISHRGRVPPVRLRLPKGVPTDLPTRSWAASGSSSCVPLLHHWLHDDALSDSKNLRLPVNDLPLPKLRRKGYGDLSSTAPGRRFKKAGN